VNAYLTSTGSFLPGLPIDNSEIEDFLGRVEGKSSRLKARILKSNGIKTGITPSTRRSARRIPM